MLEGTHIIITTISKCKVRTEVQTREVPRGQAQTPMVTRHTNRVPLWPHNKLLDPSTRVEYQGLAEEPIKTIGEVKESSIGDSERRQRLL